MFKLLLKAGLVAALLGAGNAPAAVICAATTNAIRQALSVAETNGEADTIRIIIGSYAPTTGSVAFSYSSVQGNALTIEGGWTFGCGERVDRADLTVLGGSGARPVLDIGTNGFGSVKIRNLSIKDGKSAQRGAGLSILAGTNPFAAAFTGTITVERVVFLFNRSAAEAGALVVDTSGGNVAVRGNLIAFNRCGDDNCALLIHSRDPAPVPVLFGGNTIALNTCIPGASSCNSGGARFTGQQSAVIYDNLFALHSGGDLSLQNPVVEADLYYNNIEVLIGNPDSETGTVNVANPQFVDALAEDFRLKPTSPVRNLGNAPFPLPGVDLDGKPRIIESAPDLGAYETPDYLFVDGFDGNS